MFRDNMKVVKATATGTAAGATFALTDLGLTADEAKSVTGATILAVAVAAGTGVTPTGSKAVITGSNLVITRQTTPSAANGDIYTVGLHMGQIPEASVASA